MFWRGLLETPWGPTIREGDRSDVLDVAMRSDEQMYTKQPRLILSETMYKK